jgi:hypothetical protein
MHEYKRSGGLAPLLATGTLALAGCGGGGNSDASFISKVDGVCRSAQSQIDALGQPATSSPAELATFFRKVLPLAQAEGARIRAIKAPGDKANAVAAANANHDESITLLEQAIAAADAGDTSALNLILTRVQALNGTADALATRIGVTDCVSKNSGAGTTTATTTT